MKKRILTVLLAVCLVLALGTVSALADDEPVYTYENNIVYKTVDGAKTELTADELAEFSGVNLHGIAGFNETIFPTMKDAYDAISAKLTENGGLKESGLSDEAFNALYTDRVTGGEHEGVSLTWTIFGTVDWGSDLPTYFITGGRAAAWYGSDAKTIREITVTGYGDNAVINYGKNPAMSYQWWGESTDSHQSFTLNNLTINSKLDKINISANFRTSFDLNVTECTINGGIYHYFNGKGNVIVKDCVFNGETSISNALMVQGHKTEPLNIEFTGNEVSGYERGINIDQVTATVNISGNTITPGKGYSAIQIAGCERALISGNTIYDQGNFLTFHENIAKNHVDDRTITVKDNVINSVDGVQGYLVYDDIEAVGKYGDTQFFTLEWENNTVDSNIITTQGIKGDKVSDLTNYIDDVLNPSARIGDTTYETLQDAAANAVDGDTIVILKDVELATPVSITAPNVTIEGNGHSISYTGGDPDNLSDGALITAEKNNADNLTIKNATIVASNIKHGVQFYCVEGGELSNVTIIGGAYTSVNVNGSTGIEIRNCTLNTNGYAHIEYGMGGGVTTVPSIVVENNVFQNSSAAQIYADFDTTAAVETAMGGDKTGTEVRNEIMSHIANAGGTDVSVTMLFGSEQSPEVVTDISTGKINIPTPHEITIANTANGTVDTSLSNASAGAVITITATPNSGYGVSGVVVTGPDGAVTVTRVDANTYTFVMPDGPVTVSVTFGNGLPFTDVSAGQWFYDYVSYVYFNGLMDGTSATTFEPNANMTRAMVWAILARIDGETVTGATWQTVARTWAMANGVSDGSDPNGLVTREQFATMLWRYAGEPASTYSLASFTDANSVSDWAETAMAWAVEHGIITGMTDTTLVPQGSATRAQCAAMLMRFVELG